MIYSLKRILEQVVYVGAETRTMIAYNLPLRDQVVYVSDNSSSLNMNMLVSRDNRDVLFR